MTPVKKLSAVLPAFTVIALCGCGETVVNKHESKAASAPQPALSVAFRGASVPGAEVEIRLPNVNKDWVAIDFDLIAASQNYEVTVGFLNQIDPHSRPPPPGAHRMVYDEWQKRDALMREHSGRISDSYAQYPYINPKTGAAMNVVEFLRTHLAESHNFSADNIEEIRALAQWWQENSRPEIQ